MLVLTFTEDIIIQSEPEKQDKNQISEKKLYNLSEFEKQILQRFRFCFKSFTTRQILKWKKLYIESKFFDQSDFQ